MTDALRRLDCSAAMIDRKSCGVEGLSKGELVDALFASTVRDFHGVLGIELGLANVAGGGNANCLPSAIRFPSAPRSSSSISSSMENIMLPSFADTLPTVLALCLVPFDVGRRSGLVMGELEVRDAFAL